MVLRGKWSHVPGNSLYYTTTFCRKSVKQNHVFTVVVKIINMRNKALLHCTLKQFFFLKKSWLWQLVYVQTQWGGYVQVSVLADFMEQSLHQSFVSFDSKQLQGLQNFDFIKQLAFLAWLASINLKLQGTSWCWLCWDT